MTQANNQFAWSRLEGGQANYFFACFTRNPRISLGGKPPPLHSM